jgi:hypothetical protein
VIIKNEGKIKSTMNLIKETIYTNKLARRFAIYKINRLKSKVKNYEKKKRLAKNVRSYDEG